MDKDKLDLNAPAFGPDSQKLDAPVVEAEAEPIEVKKEETEDNSEEESKVPYSRFKKFHDEAIRLRQEAEEWRNRAETIKPEAPKDDIPEFWKKLYGDSDASKEAWKIQSEQNETIKAEARKEALEAVRNERYEQAERTEANVQTLDDNFEDLSAFVGRDLTEKEQSEVLDIVDKYTPKDSEGNYAGPIMDFDKAWEIHELRNQVTKAPKTQARDAVASLTSSQSQGDTTITEKDKNFNPLDWNAWRKRIE